MLNEEEDDYMSDKFLNESVESTVRPGLLHSNKQKREHELYKKNLSLKRSFKEVSREKTVDALNTAIPETNKGFKLLSKMGYTPGSGLGKSKAGPSNPIGIELKDDKTGLGLKTKLKEIETSTAVASAEAFRSTMKKRRELSDLKYDYSRIRRACRCFDEKDDLSKPIHYWFWPDEPPPSLQNVDSDNSSSSESETEEEKTERERRENEKLLTPEELQQRVYQISRYLREKYNYCLWCGFQYDDEKDMEEACPGRTREEHEGNSRTTLSEHEEED